MKVSELTGVLLDLWVAKAEDFHVMPSLECGVKDIDGTELPFSPSLDWADGGPIIERE